MTDTALSATGNDRIAMGANMSPFDLIASEIADLYDEAKNWADGKPITSEAEHKALSDLYDMLHAAGKKADELRVSEVAPLDEAKAAIQERYHPLIGDTKKGKGKVVRGKEVLNAVLAAWRQKIAAEKAAAAEKARREAEEERAKAEAAIRASADDLEARERAEEALALAKDADVFASRQERKAATGTGLRTVWTAELTDLNTAVRHYWKLSEAPFIALVTELASQDVRAGKREIPGFNVTESKRAI